MRFLLIVAFAVLAHGAQGQPMVGSVGLTLGEPKTLVWARMQHYRVDTTKGGWSVSDVPSGKLLGQLRFTNDKLSAVTRFWDQRDGTPGSAIIAALQQIAPGKECYVDGGLTKDPSGDLDAVVVTCGTHSVEISTLGQNLFVEERWFRGPSAGGSAHRLPP